MKKIIGGCLLAWLLVSPVFAQQISNNIKGLLSSEGSIVYGDEPNSLIVTDYPGNVERIAHYLEVIDIPPQQVQIEAKVVEVTLGSENSLGINWQAFADENLRIGRMKVSSSTDEDSGFGVPGPITQAIPYMRTFFPAGSTQDADSQNPFTLTIFDDNLNIVLNALANKYDTNILSAPSVTTVNNREAQIQIVQSIPWAEPQVELTEYGTAVTWTIHFENVGITLKATPTINDDGKITMTLFPEVSEKVDDYELVVQQGATSLPYTVPIIDKRTATTKVVIGTGQTLIIGGLIRNKTGKGETKIPFVGDLPLVGNLFKSKKETQLKTELLIFVSPTIITQNEFIRMAKEDRYLVNKDYYDEKSRRNSMLSALEKKEQDKNKELAAQLNLLIKQQRDLAEEGKRLEAAVAQEEQNLKGLEATRKQISQKKKSLQGN